LPRGDTELQTTTTAVEDRHSTVTYFNNDQQDPGAVPTQSDEHAVPTQSDEQEQKQECLEDTAPEADSKPEQIDERMTGDEQTSVTIVASVPQKSSSSSSSAAAAADSEEQVDIDLADPEVQKAAVFIQSSFKDFRQKKISQGQAKVDCSDFLVF